jgi:hypothetical protein
VHVPEQREAQPRTIAGGTNSRGGTLLFDLLTEYEADDPRNVFDIRSWPIRC